MSSDVHKTFELSLMYQNPELLQDFVHCNIQGEEERNVF